jgi:hypothetical protein
MKILGFAFWILSFLFAFLAIFWHSKGREYIAILITDEPRSLQRNLLPKLHFAQFFTVLWQILGGVILFFAGFRWLILILWLAWFLWSALLYSILPSLLEKLLKRRYTTSS